jgi:predicted RNA-binding Zn ribbon-like protein
MSEPLEAAPGPLEVVRQFINTVGLETGGEQLAEPAAAGEWFAAQGLLEPGERVAPADATKAVELREALRDVLYEERSKDAHRTAVEAVNRAAARARLMIRFSSDDVTLEPAASGMDGALGRILGIVSSAMADGSWTRLKVCGEDTCRWAFYDHSRNRSRNWCDMALCGNRNKARTYRERKRTTQ